MLRLRRAAHRFQMPAAHGRTCITERGARGVCACVSVCVCLCQRMCYLDLNANMMCCVWGVPQFLRSVV